jgi:multiple sugar transport system permease protein
LSERTEVLMNRARSLPAFVMRHKGQVRRLIGGYLFIAPWLIGFFVFTLGPFIASLFYSFTRYELLTPPEFRGLQNYNLLFRQDPRFWVSLTNTAYYSFFSVPIRMVLAFFVAMLLNQKVNGMALYRTLFYLPSVTAGVATAILWVWIFDANYGILNIGLRAIGIEGPMWLGSRVWAKPALIIMSLWNIGGTMVIYLAGLQGVPQQLYDAAAVDGAGWWRKTRHVTVPMMTPTIFFTLVMGIIGSFQVFASALVMTNGGPADATLFYVLYLYRNAFQYFRMGYASALAWVLFIIILILTLIQLWLSNRWVYYEMEAAESS